MFKAFFPKPGPFFYFCLYLVAAGGDLLAGGRRRLAAADNRRIAKNVAISAARFWSLNYLVFYAYYLFCVGAFALFWFIYSPHRWQYWSILGTSLIIFVTWFWWKLGWRSTFWYAPFYDLIQSALAHAAWSASVSSTTRLAFFSASR